MIWPVTVTSLLMLSSHFHVSSASFFGIPLKVLKSQEFSTLTHVIPNQECASDLISLVSDASNFKLWALKMLDANGKMNSDLFSNNFHQLGDYDQCLSISEEVDGRTIGGQYCTLFVSIKHEEISFANYSSHLKNYFKLLFPDWDTTNLVTQDIRKFPDKLRIFRALPDIPVNRALILLGLCVPKSCSAENLENLARHLEKKYMLPVQITMVDKACLYKGKPIEITKLDIFVYCFFTIIVLIIASSTIYDLNLRQSGQGANWWVSFSAYTNLENLFKETKNYNLTFIDGLKALTSCWVIVAHLALIVSYLLENPFETLFQVRNSGSALFAMASLYSMASFFTISGFLVSYNYFKYPEQKSTSLLSFYGKRFLRLTPPLLMGDFIHASVLKFLADGPFGAFVVNVFTNTCQNNWWQDLFIFFNWSPYEQCQIHSWSTLMDAKLYLLTPLFLFFIKKYPKTVLTGSTLAVVTGIVYSTLITIDKGIGISLFGWNTDFLDFIHFSPIYRLPAWLLGIILGYLLREDKIKISRRLNLVLWMVSIYTMYKLIFGQVVFFTEEYSVYRAALWNGLSNPLWSLSLCFIIFSCANGNGGFMNTFLSHSVFRVLNKLSYSIYITHMCVIYIYLGNKKTFYFSALNMITAFVQIFLITLACSLLLYLGCEGPTVALRYHVEKNSKRRKDEIKSS